MGIYKVGDKVKLNKKVKVFKHGMGSVDYDEIGKIIKINIYGHIIVDFPNNHRWNGLDKEVVLVDRKKFFKRLPNNFTGTIEVENGYIVEKEILDEKEREYLSNVIKPFKDKVEYIIKDTAACNEYIKITIKKDSSLCFPNFEKGTKYKGMEKGKEYTLEELGL